MRRVKGEIEIRVLVFSLVFAAAFAAAVPVALAVTVEIAPSSDGDRTVQIAAAERRNGHVGLRFDGTGALASILENATGRELVGEKCPFMDDTLAPCQSPRGWFRAGRRRCG